MPLSLLNPAIRQNPVFTPVYSRRAPEVRSFEPLMLNQVKNPLSQTPLPPANQEKTPLGVSLRL
jgi:hypothetical protein